MAVGAVKRLVDVQDRLNVVGAWRQIGECAQRRSGRAAWHLYRISRIPAINVHTEDLLRLKSPCHLKARLALQILGYDHSQTTIHRHIAHFGFQMDLEPGWGCQQKRSDKTQ